MVQGWLFYDLKTENHYMFKSFGQKLDKCTECRLCKVVIFVFKGIRPMRCILNFHENV